MRITNCQANHRDGNMLLANRCLPSNIFGWLRSKSCGTMGLDYARKLLRSMTATHPAVPRYPYPPRLSL